MRRRFPRARWSRAFTADCSVFTAWAISSTVMSSYSARISDSRCKGGSKLIARETNSVVSKCEASRNSPAVTVSSSSGSSRSSARHRFRMRLRAIAIRNGRGIPRRSSYFPGWRSNTRKHSCVISSANSMEPVMRQAKRYTESFCSRKIDLKWASVTVLPIVTATTQVRYG